ncbi:NAD(P)H-quinone oxidoreductase [Denitratisoma sp. DHT3]|uniref:NAD(P)H-quinone oxidoreductase n=1 Tax=Denitratisoma sp. DHT3 TaxID=1981880 RepID=UPI001198C3C7|nr:NAD(P)H-quinone oxidoreductase [Denitratisoma sp. DHT3]QDX82541.1 NAD(P)H-quinone oxidoreductase [Denitratisoma sp. DHT3]
MKQIHYDVAGGPEVLRLVEAPRPQPGPGEALIEVHYAGVNRPDVVQRSGNYPPPPGSSPVLGLEVAGTIAALGAGVEGWRIGDAVAALTPGGGYAEYCVAPVGQLLPVPDGLGLAEAAGLPENWFTVWHNLMDLGRLKAGERLLVHGGSGGIGLAAIQLGKLVGAEVFATAGSAEKIEVCRAFGADWGIDYRQEDFVARIREITAKTGVDVILDMVGGPYLQKNLSLLRQDGRLVLIAFLQGSRVEFDFMNVMMRRLTITGSTMRPRTLAEKTAIRDALLQQVWPAVAAGKVRTRIHQIFPLSEAVEAHRLMESSRHMGKILLQVR